MDSIRSPSRNPYFKKPETRHVRRQAARKALKDCNRPDKKLSTISPLPWPIAGIKGFEEKIKRLAACTDIKKAHNTEIKRK